MGKIAAFWLFFFFFGGGHISDMACLSSVPGTLVKMEDENQLTKLSSDLTH